jgi:hypothetical protein
MSRVAAVAVLEVVYMKFFSVVDDVTPVSPSRSGPLLPRSLRRKEAEPLPHDDVLLFIFLLPLLSALVADANEWNGRNNGRAPVVALPVMGILRVLVASSGGKT